MTGLALFYVALMVAGFLSLVVTLIFGEIFEGLGFDDMNGDGGWFSSSALSAAIAGLGLAGFSAIQSGLPTWASVVLGLGLAAVFVVIIAYIKRLITRQQADTTVKRNSYVGTLATVIVSVPASGGFGTVQFVNTSGSLTNQTAYASDSLDHHPGDRVVITSVGAGSVTIANQ